MSNVIKGFSLYAERLKPAVLSKGERGKINSQVVVAWLVQQGIDINTIVTPEEIAHWLYKATLACYPQMLWDVRPKALDKLFENEKVRNQTITNKEQEEFAARLKAASDKKEKDKADESAQRQIDAAINSLVLDSVSNTQAYKVKIAAQASRNKQFGTPQADTLRTVLQQIEALHEAQERVHEFVGVPRSFNEMLQSSLAKRGVQL